ncbi:MAG: cytochrome c [Rhodoferax sp.]|nr:cytochrome c [Rhodoferax sp.]
MLAAASVALSLPAAAQFAKPEDAIRYRQSAMTLMQNHFGRVAAMAAGRVPFDAKVAADNAALAETLSKLPWSAFVEGTDKGATKAKPEIWSQEARFKEAAEKMQGEMGRLAQAARGGNLDAIKSAVGPTAASCKACHDAFWK